MNVNIDAKIAVGKLWIVVVAAWATGLGTASPASAADNVALEMSKAAEEIKAKIARHGEKSIVVGDFPPSGSLKANGGPLLSAHLAEQLEQIDVTVERRARFEVRGAYFAGIDPASEKPAIQIRFEIVDLNQAGDRIHEFKRTLVGYSHVALLTGATVEFVYKEDEKPPYEEFDQELEDRIDNPRAYVSNDRVSASSTSPYSMAILVKSGNEYEPRPLSLLDGEAVVRLYTDEIYAVRLINNEKFEAGVKLSIDGLNLFHFSEDAPQYRDPAGRPTCTHVIVPPRSFVDVKGWFRNFDESSEFHIKQYSEHAPPHLRNTAKVGTITAAFCAVWPKGASKPAGEPKDPDDSVTAREYTELGANVKQKYKTVKREFGVVRAVVTARYDEKPAD